MNKTHILQEWFSLDGFSEEARNLLMQIDPENKIGKSLPRKIRLKFKESVETKKPIKIKNINFPTIAIQVSPDGYICVFENDWQVGGRKMILNDPSINAVIACCKLQDADEFFNQSMHCTIRPKGECAKQRREFSTEMDPIYQAIIKSGRDLWCIGESHCLGEVRIGYHDGLWHAFIDGSFCFSYSDRVVVETKYAPEKIDDDCYEAEAEMRERERCEAAEEEMHELERNRVEEAEQEARECRVYDAHGYSYRNYYDDNYYDICYRFY